MDQKCYKSASNAFIFIYLVDGFSGKKFGGAQINLIYLINRKKNYLIDSRIRTKIYGNFENIEWCQEK